MSGDCNNLGAFSFSFMQAPKHRLEGLGSGECGSLAGTNLFPFLVEVVAGVLIKLLAQSVDKEGG